MRELLKRYRYIISIIALPYILLIILLVVPTKKSVTLPGDVSNINDVIKIDDSKESEGGFYSIFTSSTENLTLFQLGLCKSTDYAYIYDYDEDYNSSEDARLSKIMKKNSITNALIAALNEANIPHTATFSGIVITNTEDWSSFEVGDIILGDSRDSIIELIKKSKAQETKIKIKRLKSNDYEELEIDPDIVDDSYGITFVDMPYYDYYTVKTEISYKTYDNGVGGPSGGLLQALSIFNSLTEFDYTRGLKISGTGTLSIDGNVGVIGGIKQKIYTAAKSKCDIFFTPDGEEGSYEHQNYLDAASVIDEANETYNTDMKLVPVKTLIEAITYLRNYEN